MDEKIEAILDKYERDRGLLVSMLQDIQKEHFYLPREALVQVAGALDIPLSQIYSVATFFKAFSLSPRGRHLVSVCLGTACHVRGAVRLVEDLERRLATARGETTPDQKFTLDTVRCVGACALGPVVTVDKDYFGEMQASRLDAMLAGYS
jgi:NADH-quinone oxidoreductase subunit E